MRAVGLLLLAAISARAVNPEQRGPNSVVAPLSMHGLEQEAMSSARASRREAEMEQDDAREEMRRSHRRMKHEEERLRGISGEAHREGQVELQRMQKKAVELHSKQNSQQSELLAAVNKYKAKQRRAQEHLRVAANEQRTDDLAQRVQLGDAVLSVRQDAALERREKKWEAKQARLQFLKQAQELSTEAIQAIGTEKEKKMAEAAEESHERTIALEGEYQEAKRNVRVGNWG